MKPKPQVESVVPKLRILTIRDQRVLLDADLARLYGVETRALNQAVKRNLNRFPIEFVFQFTDDEILSISQTVTSKSAALTSQIVMSKPGRGGRRHRPYAFTELRLRDLQTAGRIECLGRGPGARWRKRVSSLPNR